MRNISAVIPLSDEKSTRELISELSRSDSVSQIFTYSPEPACFSSNGSSELVLDNIHSSAAIKTILMKAECEYLLLIIKPVTLTLAPFALERFMRIAADTRAAILYSNYNEFNKAGVSEAHPTIDYQTGSIRDDFDFGPLLLIRRDCLLDSISKEADYKFAGFYDCRLRLSESNPIFRIPEYLYTSIEPDRRNSGVKQFDYVDPRNRALQIEMETSVSDHLNRIGALIKPPFREIAFADTDFETEASVIIPVKNRVKTIREAIQSALSQRASFKYNVIVVDNHSSDGTTDIVRSMKESDSRLIHIIPERNDLLIGGCWNKAVQSEFCGRFAVQLDSDDIYKDNDTLQTIADTFYMEKCAMVIGAYILTDFYLNEIPPGLIDHSEWTESNGTNNALRINGLGAPRAFYTPILREINIPNVSYGEDYFLGISISREYKIGRIYKPLYFCRRWEENTDSALDIQKLNSNNLFKDRLRTFEILARQKKNKTRIKE